MPVRKPAAPRSAAGRLYLFLFAFLGIVLLVAAIENWSHFAYSPEAPWNSPQLKRTPGYFAHVQINRIAGDRARCLGVLRSAHIGFTPLDDQQIDSGCSFTNVLRLDAATINSKDEMVMTCGLAASFNWWEGQLQPIALRDLHARIVKIDQAGTYACRNVDSAMVGPRSQHATANAIDVTAFHLSDGRTITVLKDWGKPTAEGRFLIEAHAAACKVFNGTLGPDYNSLHASHFHLDLGPYWLCR